RAVAGGAGGPVVAVAGRTLRGSPERAAGQAALRLVSAWATASGLVGGQVATDAKSNEITARPTLRRRLALAGATVTSEAMGCQTVSAAPSVEQGADYVLALQDS